MRGGTSKGLFFLASDLPDDEAQRTRTLLSAFGSPDRRQIDGLGGGHPLTSKLAIVSRSSAPGADVDYTFGQVSLDRPFIDFSGNCGNISSAVGPFAVATKLVSPAEPRMHIRILNTNTRKTIVADVPVADGQFVSDGPYRIDGVPGTGAEIRLHFLDPGGVVTGRLLPTGRPRDSVTLADGRVVDVTIVDAGNPTAFMPAAHVGLSGTELPGALDAHAQALAILDEVRARVCEMLGLCQSWQEVLGRPTTYPKVAVVAPASDYRTVGDRAVSGDEIDLHARVLTIGQLHQAFAVTAAVPAAAAARVAGSVVHEVCRPHPTTVRIGHPSGVMAVDVVHRREGDQIVVDEVIVGRTARTLMEGTVLIPA